MNGTNSVLLSQMTVALFVYGTLKRGDCRHVALAGQTFLGEARTAPRYRMHNVGSYPALVEALDGLAIEGELWGIDNACLTRLDDVEGVDAGLYERRPIQLAQPFAHLSAQSYFFLQSTAGLADCGPCWRPQPTATWDGGPPPYP